MGQILHGSATTTEAIRRAIQNSQESLRALANRLVSNACAFGSERDRPVKLIRATLVHPYPARKDGGRFSVVRDGSRRLLRDSEHRCRFTLYRRAKGAGAAIQIRDTSDRSYPI